MVAVVVFRSVHVWVVGEWRHMWEVWHSSASEEGEDSRWIWVVAGCRFKDALWEGSVEVERETGTTWSRHALGSTVFKRQRKDTAEKVSLAVAMGASETGHSVMVEVIVVVRVVVVAMAMEESWSSVFHLRLFAVEGEVSAGLGCRANLRFQQAQNITRSIRLANGKAFALFIVGT